MFFIVGCGRSGTTFLGESIGAHPDVCYLNEPREIWRAAYPEMNIWNKRYANRRIHFSAADYERTKADTLKAGFAEVFHQSGKKCLVEKLPINAFRIGLIHRIFPAARFIHIKRHQADVAKSIARKCPQWYGGDDYKWRLLSELYHRQRGDWKLPPLDLEQLSPYERGRVEWQLAEHFIDEAKASTLPPGTTHELTYEGLVEDFQSTMMSLWEFMNVRPAIGDEPYS